jgi:CDP-glycerol glycerophosphotransferase (TagB/SpsB family)/glycosyltransferase involved in cell wall biosynthesis
MSPRPSATPRLSVVLAVHDEQAYLSECAASVLDQGAGDVELMAVDDASRDHAPELLDELADRDPRVRVHHVAERSGPGAARNLGLELAAGEYVWFASTTDRIPPGGLATILRRLAAVRPDVLLVHHSIEEPLGEIRHGPHRELLIALADRDAWTLDERGEAADLAHHAWNKIFRREFLERLDVSFANGGCGELAVTWPALLAADRITAWAVPAYVRRRPANAVRDRLVEGSPFDVFARYEDVFAFLTRRGDATATQRRLLVDSMLRHELSLLRQVPGPERRDFLHHMSEAVARHGTPSASSGSGSLGRLRAGLIARDDHRALALLEDALDTRRAVRRHRAALVRNGARATRRIRRAGLEEGYRARRRAPLDPDLAVFAAYWYRGYACNPRAIFEKARELVPSLHGVWVVKPDAVAGLPPGVDYVLPGTRRYYDVLARASYFVNNVNFPDHLVKREGTVHVMTHHGTPLKWMGLDERLRPAPGKRQDFAALLRRCGRWDYSISSNAFSTVVWERVYPVPYESLEVGYPRNDALSTASDADVRRIRAELAIPSEATAVLYAPTHRDYQSGYVPLLDLGAVADALGSDHVLLARAHYFYEPDSRLHELHRQGRVRDVSRHPSIEELCLAADVLVTDYSALMFDYAVLDRPIVVHAPDWEVYRATRGTYFDLMEEPPGAVTSSAPELIEALGSRAAWSDGAGRLRADFRERFCSLDDGHAAERVVRRLWPEAAAAGQPEATLAR